MRKPKKLVPGMTERRKEVLHLVALGLDNREIAARIVCEYPTVGKHIHDLLVILGLRHRAQLIVYALKQGIVTFDDILGASPVNKLKKAKKHHE